MVVAQTGNTGTGASVSVRANIVLSPVLSIELGSGPKSGDPVRYTYASADDYRNGKNERRNKQLRVFAIGCGYKVDVSFAPRDCNDCNDCPILRVLQFGIGKAGNNIPLRNAWPRAVGEAFYISSTGQGIEELDVGYRFEGGATNMQYFDKLARTGGNAKTYTVDITFTVSPL